MCVYVYLRPQGMGWMRPPGPGMVGMPPMPPRPQVPVGAMTPEQLIDRYGDLTVLLQCSLACLLACSLVCQGTCATTSPQRDA